MCGKHYRDYNLVMALRLKVLEIECVVKDLIKCVGRVAGLSDLEFNNDDNPGKQEYSVCPSSHPRNRVLQ